MNSLLIDFNKITHLNLLKKRVSPIPKTKFYLGLVIIIPPAQLEKIDYISKDNAKIDYLNDPQFVNTIEDYAYINYDKKRKICEIIKNSPTLHLVLNNALKNIPKDVIIWVGLPLKNANLDKFIIEYVKLGFQYPYISNMSPLGYKVSTYNLCLLRVSNNNSKNEAYTLKDVKYVLNHFLLNKNPTCELNIKLSEQTIKYFRKLSYMGSTFITDGKMNQKEIAGALYVSKITKNFAYILDINKKSLITGQEEGVEVVPGLYNFHSHPIEAYKRHNVKLGWPSAQDYVGFLLSFIDDNTIIHLIISIEGIYLLSLTKYWLKNKKKTYGRKCSQIYSEKI